MSPSHCLAAATAVVLLSSATVMAQAEAPEPASSSIDRVQIAQPLSAKALWRSFSSQDDLSWLSAKPVVESFVDQDSLWQPGWSLDSEMCSSPDGALLRVASWRLPPADEPLLVDILADTSAETLGWIDTGRFSTWATASPGVLVTSDRAP